MSAGWVAGSVRARALARRRIGAAQARRLAASGSLAEALALLAATPYRTALGLGGAGYLGAGPEAADTGVAFAGTPGAGGAAEPGSGAVGADAQQALSRIQRAITAALLWDLRVLAGWLPQGGLPVMRALAGWFEIANVSERLAQLGGRPADEFFRLGALATAWPGLRQAGSLAEVRSALAASVWRDPGGDTPAELEVGMRARWAQRVAGLGGSARDWAAAALVLLLAAERFGEQQSGAERHGAGLAVQPVLRSVASRLLGQPAADAATFDELAGRLPRRLAWVLDPAASPGDLWRAEVGWWARAERQAHGLLASSGFDSGPVIGTAVLLAADARRTAAALEMAARGGRPVEVFDAVSGAGQPNGVLDALGAGSRPAERVLDALAQKKTER